MTYEYKCQEDGSVKDIDIPMADDNPKKLKCPKCGKMSMIQVIASTSVVIPEAFVRNSPFNFTKKIHKKYY